MLRSRKNYGAPAGGLILAGLAAFAYYKYSKLTPEAKQELVTNLKDKGRNLVSQFKAKKDSLMQNTQLQNSNAYGS